MLSNSLGPGKLTVEDMAARPDSGEVYLAVSVGADKTPAIVAVTSDQTVRKLDLASLKSTAATLKNADDSKYEFWKETPERSFTVTDMKWNSGERYARSASTKKPANFSRWLAPSRPSDGARSDSTVLKLSDPRSLVQTVGARF
ncbi:hypothetical protein ACWGS9_27295 [Bradyrhizobium sp. Arg314]